MSDGSILYYAGHKQTNIPQAVVPKMLRDQIMNNTMVEIWQAIFWTLPLQDIGTPLVVTAYVCIMMP